MLTIVLNNHLKQGVWIVLWSLNSGEKGLFWCYKSSSGYDAGIIGSVRPRTDVALTFEMSQGVKAYRQQLGHPATNALIQFICRQWWTAVGEDV